MITKYSKQNNIITVYDSNNNMYNCDILLDCTYNQLGLSKKEYIYELTLSLVFEKNIEIEFNGITIMDGKFCSLYPLDIKK